MPAIAQSKRLVVTTMPGPRWEGALRASADAFKAAKPDVEVEILVSPYAEHYQRIGTSLTEDATDFDRHLFDPVLIGQSHPKLLPLTDLFESDPEWRDHYLAGVPEFFRGSWSWDGVPYSVVHDANCMMTWWRRDVFEELGLAEPATFEEILDNARALNERQANSGYMTCAARNAWFLGMTFTGMMHGFGGKWYENDLPDRFGRIFPDEGPGALLLNSEENLAAMRMLHEQAQTWNPASLNAQEFENVEAWLAFRSFEGAVLGRGDRRLAVDALRLPDRPVGHVCHPSKPVRGRGTGWGGVDTHALLNHDPAVESGTPDRVAATHDRSLTRVRGDRARDIAMVFQDYALYPHMSVRQNITFNLRNRRVESSEIDRRLRETAGMLGIERHLDSNPGQLSGGERQRIALGRALIRQPRVFLMDEPLSNLDLKLREAMRLEIGRLHDRLGITIIYVTHDQAEAMTLSTSVAIMNEGKLQQVDRPDVAYARPANTFVAKFIGSPSMNLFNAVFSDGVLRLAGGEGAVSIGACHGVGEGARVVAGVRPHELGFREPGQGTLPVRVSFTERLGRHNFVVCTPLPDASSLAAGDSIQVETPVDREYEAGTVAHLGPDPAAVKLFDAAGNSIVVPAPAAERGQAVPVLPSRRCRGGG